MGPAGGLRRIAVAAGVALPLQKGGREGGEGEGGEGVQVEEGVDARENAKVNISTLFARAPARGLPFLCGRHFFEDEYRLLASKATSRSMLLEAATNGDGNDRSAATSNRFFLCARQCDHDQDHHAAIRLGQGTKRRAERRPVRLRLDRRQPIHLAQGDFGRDIRDADFPRVRRSPTSASRRSRSAAPSTTRSRASTSTSARFNDANEAVTEALIGSRYVTLNNSIQDKSYRQADAGLPDAGDGWPAQLSVQLRPGVRERNADRPRASAASTALASSSMPSRS